MTSTMLLQLVALVWGAGASAAVAISDVRRRVIPNRIVLPASAGIAVLLGCTQNVQQFIIAVFGGLALAAAHLLLALAGGLGGGDVKLALLVGILLGYFGGWGAVWLGGALGWVLAGVGALILAALRRTAASAAESRAPGLPFAPFLLAASWAVILVCI